LFSLIVSLPLGILGAVYKDTWIDELSRILAFGGVSIPRFWMGLMMILVFGQYWSQWFGEGLISTGGYVPITAGPIEFLHYMLAPAIAIGLGYAAITARITRSAMIDELNKDYVRTARSKGLREQLIIGKHVFQNAMLPVITVVGMQLGFVINGVVVVEEVFAIPGIGRLMFSAVANQDLPTVQALLLFIATAYVLMNLLVDLGYAFLDPRIVYEEEA
jgi:peptide/nickel transport system permease protein